MSTANCHALSLFGLQFSQWCWDRLKTNRISSTEKSKNSSHCVKESEKCLGTCTNTTMQ